MAMTTRTRRIATLAAMAVLCHAAYVAVGLRSAFGYLQRALAGNYRIHIELAPAVAAPARGSINEAKWLATSAMQTEDAEEPGPADQDAGELKRQSLDDLVNSDPEFQSLVYNSDPAVRSATLDFFND